MWVGWTIYFGNFRMRRKQRALEQVQKVFRAHSETKGEPRRATSGFMEAISLKSGPADLAGMWLVGLS
jgi:hypothetical protein